MNKKMRRPGTAPVRQKKPFSVLNVVNIILSVILALSILITIFVVREETEVYYDSENSMYYSLSDGNYSTLAERYYDNALGREDDPRIKKIADYYAVGRYFEKAFFANAFDKAGMTEKAAKCRAQMEKIEPEMGQFSAEKERILDIFNGG